MVDVVDVEVVVDDDVELMVVVEEVVLVDVVVDVVVVTSMHSHTYVACHLLLPHLLSPTQVPPVHLKTKKNYSTQLKIGTHRATCLNFAVGGKYAFLKNSQDFSCCCVLLFSTLCVKLELEIKFMCTRFKKLFWETVKNVRFLLTRCNFFW